VGGVDQVHASGDRFLHEGDMLGRIGQPVRPEPEPGDVGMAEPELRGRVHGPHVTTSSSVGSVGSIVVDDQIHPSDVTLDGRRVAEDGLSTSSSYRTFEPLS
jgi:hypothetical protein